MWWVHDMQLRAFQVEGSQALTHVIPAERVPEPLQQWLQASSIQEQLVAVGYAQQTLRELMAAL
jgi:hypothetical protein